LAPLRAELLRRARADADRTRREAADAAAVINAEAIARRDAILAAAVTRGAAEAAQLRAAHRAMVRHGIRADELAAQRAVYEELVEQVTEAVCALRHEPGYPSLHQRLADRARELLGPDAVVTDAPGGGIVASAAGRRLDYSLVGFAGRAIDRLGADIAGLWSS
jgi:vacuolar-type H+-ATPase subunit E/Vma4